MAENMDRRKFLKMIGGGSALVVLGAGCQSLGFSTATANTTSGSTTACKFGYINDPWPGECRDYVDKNGNGICDYSEVTTSEETTSVEVESTSQPAAETSVSDQTTAEQLQTDQNTTSIQAQTETDQITTTQQSQTASTSSELVVLCRRGCSYPGHCNQYVDSDATGICDLSEGVAMAAYQQAQTGRQRPGRNK